MRNLIQIFSFTFFLAMAQPAAAENPYLAPNESRITLRGTIVTAGASSFELDYGEGIVTLQVAGDLDNDLFERREIVAGSIITLQEDKGRSQNNNKDDES